MGDRGGGSSFYDDWMRGMLVWKNSLPPLAIHDSSILTKLQSTLHTLFSVTYYLKLRNIVSFD